MSGRPPILFPLFAGLETLDGIGPKTAQALSNAKIAAPRDLLFTLPASGIDRTPRATVQGGEFPSVVTVEVNIGKHWPPKKKGQPYRITVEDAAITFSIVFFRSHGDYVQRLLPTGQRRIISGKVELYDGVPQMTHPDHVVLPEEADTIPEFEPVYPLTAGITQRIMGRAVTHALGLVPDLEEWIDEKLLKKQGWSGFQSALDAAHNPTAVLDLAGHSLARQRLAYDEFFAHQLTLAIARAQTKRRAGVSSLPTGQLQKRVMGRLGYEPTGAQVQAIQEIADDMALPLRMNRLLQGDVGSGKTLVAFLALLVAVEAGGQGVLMAPTEILARQHLESLLPLAGSAGVSLDILTGRDKGRERHAKLDRLASGDLSILVGTHAVFQADVAFHDLRLAVIDEQHRFGVRQRMELGAKGRAVDVLVMTATPIPRSLALTQYGDMDVSILYEKPPGRKPITTAMVNLDRLDEVVARLRRAVADGKQCYWVCPLVEESEVIDLTAAEQRFERLRAVFDEDQVCLVHGQMPPAEKDAAMQRFQSGQARVMVATTVIEVGVNVPNATIMVIERAETFGLAQLHQLRGRVGRGSDASTCLLLYQSPLTETGRRRLEILRDSEDGFLIAQTDLEMRGAGDVIGTAQSGLPRFQVADIETQAALMQTAQKDARLLLEQDPKLDSARGKAARHLLWLMRQDEAMRLMGVG